MKNLNACIFNLPGGRPILFSSYSETEREREREKEREREREIMSFHKSYKLGGQS
jgi:hypothetical protein